MFYWQTVGFALLLELFVDVLGLCRCAPVLEKHSGHALLGGSSVGVSVVFDASVYILFIN